MSTPDDGLEARVSLLEQEVARLRERDALSGADAAAARVLAGGADHDVSEVRAELRAHIRALNALRETQLDQGIRLTALEAEVHEGFTEMRDGFTEMRTGFATMRTGMVQIVTLIEGITGPGQN